jgi:ubiquinone/menaquinone biosynthesis C-methylase UbiE
MVDTLPNRAIYATRYTPDQLRLRHGTAYDRWMIQYRLGLIERYGRGQDVLDLCCGTGEYLIPALGLVKRAVGVDFTRRFLEAFRGSLNGELPANLSLVEGDATRLPFQDGSFDFVFSYCSLYSVPRVDAALREIGRTLRPGGHAAVELGNLHSLNTVVVNAHHRENGWTKPCHIPYADIRRFVRQAELEPVEWRAFQLLPMYGPPRRLRFLYPLLSSWWKTPMGVAIGGKMLDEWVSSVWPLRYVAFRHFLVLKKGRAA